MGYRDSIRRATWVVAGALVVVCLLGLATAPAIAWHHGSPGVFIGLGPIWWPPPY